MKGYRTLYFISNVTLGKIKHYKEIRIFQVKNKKLKYHSLNNHWIGPKVVFFYYIFIILYN